MDITTKQAVSYVGAGVGTAVGLAALRHGGNGTALALGAATGLASGGVQTFVQGTTGSSELGWAAAAGSGAVAGAVLLGGTFGRPGLSPIQARGIGAGIGLAAGVFAPIVAGMVLAQLD